VLAVIAPVVVMMGTVRWLGQQQDQAALVDATAPSASSIALVVVVAAIVSVLLVTIGRLVGHAVVAVDRLVDRWLPTWAAHAIVGVATVAVLASGTNRLVVDQVVGAANASFGTLDDTTEAGIEQPDVPEQSGGPGSLVAWDTLGLQGRTFAGSATPIAELEETASTDVEVAEPIRVYVGLQSADSPRERAELAVAELERTGAFDRPVLVVATTTGTGWINPVAAESIERLWNGRTAIVGQQYSYLPSWISFLVDKEKAAETGTALIEAVAARWRELPEDERPRLVLFGESLGSFGSEAALDGDDAKGSVDNVRAHGDAALYIGPTSSNPIRAQLTAERSADSPVWRPEVDLPTDARFAISADELAVPAGDDIAVTYLQHPSDPVTWWDMATLWRRPEWLAEERGPDVPSATRWAPFVTWSQTVADLAAGFSAGRGHGHNYDDAWTQSWLAVAPPPDRDEARVLAIEAALADP
jgi:uncharacterized membrane protein